ncbi:MAG: hypothetical protein U0840_19850 [Gemmataceae bacterium]
MHRRHWRAVMAVMILGLLGGSPASGAEKVFRAGAYAQNVNPKKYPVSVNGNFSDRLAKGAIDPLHARCLVLDDGTTQVAFCVVDSCMIPREVVDAAKRLAQKTTGIPGGNIIISATHTHTAPTLAGVFQSEANPEYVRQLAEQIAEGIQKAHQARQSAQIGWGTANNARQVFNRRWFREQALIPRDPFGRTTDKVQMNPGYQAKGLERPAGPTDPTVSVLSVQTAAGEPLALLANYSLHYVGGVDALSADYFGVFAERIKELVKGPASFVGILSNGTSGDINNINFGGSAPGSRRPGEQMRNVAYDVADTALEAYRKIKHTDKVNLAAAAQELELGVRLPDEKDLERAREVLEKARGRVLRTSEEVYARETTLMAKYPAKVQAMLQVVRINDLAICSIPCEVFVEIGLELRKQSPFRHTFVIELANGYNGYLPTPKQHALGGYETWRARSSYLEVDASTKITRVLLGLLNQVK